MSKCKLEYEGAAFQALQDQFGGDIARATNYILKVGAVRNREFKFSPRFLNWYKKETGRELSQNALKEDATAGYIIRYSQQSANVKNGVAQKEIEDKKVTTFGYSSYEIRQEGIKHSATFLLMIWNNFNRANTVLGKDARVKYLTELKRAWNTRLYEVIAEAKKTTVEDVAAQLKEVSAAAEQEAKDAGSKAEEAKTIGRTAGRNWLKEQLGDTSRNVLKRNLWALTQELNSSPESALAYIDEVLLDGRLGSVNSQIRSDSSSEEEDAKHLNETEGDLEVSNSDDGAVIEYDPDTMISHANSHLGTYTNFKAHLGEKITNYLNTLPRLVSNSGTGNNAVLDTNNTYGVAETMDASSCASMLYGICHRFTTMENMIAAIRNVARDVKGFEAFTQLADDLERDYDFATEFRTVFAKTVMGKLQVRIENGEGKLTKSNRNSDRIATFVFNLFNDANNTLIGMNRERKDGKIAEIDNIASEIQRTGYKINSLITRYCSEVIKLTRTYLPSISEASIRAYIELNNNPETSLEVQFRNAREILTAIKSLNNQVDNVQQTYFGIESAIREEARKQHVRRAHGQAEDNTELTRLYGEKYLNVAAESVLINFAQTLEPYSVVQLQLNSTNVLGNNSSDVINNSYLTYLKKAFEQTREETTIVDGKTVTVYRNEALEAWGRDRMKSNQYKYSPIMLQQYDEHGNKVGKAIFDKVNGRLVLTEYAEELLDIALFDGSSNMDKGTNATYAQMQEGSYLPTSFMAYLKTEQPDNFNISVATYFCRTPSDAPKNFGIRSIRYNTKELLISEDPNYSTKASNEIVDEIFYELNKEEYAPFATQGINMQYTAPKSDSGEVYTQAQKALAGAILGRKDAKIILQGPNDDSRTSEFKEIKEGDLKGQTATTVMYGTKAYVFVGEAKRDHLHRTILTKPRLVGVLTSDKQAVKTTENFIKDEQLRNAVRADIQTTIDKHDVSRQIYRNGKFQESKVWLADKKVINKNHEVYKLLLCRFKQELVDCAVALRHYFDVDETGYVNDGGKGTVKVIKINEEKNKKGYKFYHLGEDGKVLSGNETDGYSLGGNVFHSNKFTLSVVEVDENGRETVRKRNFLDECITAGYTTDESMISLLYGGAGVGNYLHSTVEKDGSISVTLTEKQQSLVDEKLTEFLQEYLAQAFVAMDKKREFIPEADFTNENIVDYAINYLLFYMNSDDLFEGDTKFYLDSQTILKRAKEIQGSGVPYGIVDYLNQDSTENDLVSSSFLNEGSLVTGQKEDGTPIKTRIIDILDKDYVRKDGTTHPSLFKGVRQTKHFRATTIKNTQMTNTNRLNALRKHLVDNVGLDEEVADTLLFGPIEEDDLRHKGFQRTKVNDAQSYITVQEWVRRVAARGQLRKYLPLIQRIIANDADPVRNKLTNEDISEFIQVQKNFYYDIMYDEEYNINAPRQIKNAEFVLVPALIKGTELEVVYDMMRAAKIDQLNTVETSKAANEELVTIWDNDQNFVSEENRPKVIEQLNKNAKSFDYRFLYTQQETPQHMNAENKAGIQVVKKIIDNITPDNPLWETKQEYFKLFVANIRESFQNLMEELDVPVDSAGNIITDEHGQIQGLNKAVFYNKFKQELMRLGIDENIIDYVTLDESGEPIMPSFMNTVLTRLESVSQSLFNNTITRQKLPGFHAAQVTDVGWRGLNSIVDGRRYSDDLAYHPDEWKHKETGEVISQRAYDKLEPARRKDYTNIGPSSYIEVRLPLSAFGINRKSRHYAKMTDEEILKELEDKGLDKVLGYRIPTEGKQSVCIMKCVGFVSDAYGSTIVVPNDWVSQTGSDFDIDSVYAIQFATYKANGGEIKKVPYFSSRKAEGSGIVKPNEHTWFSYVMSHTRTVDPNVSEKIKERLEELEKIVLAPARKHKNVRDAIYDEIKQKCDKNTAITILKNLHLATQGIGGDGIAAYRDRVDARIKMLYKLKTHKLIKGNKEAAKLVDRAIAAEEDLFAYISDDANNYGAKKYDAIREVLQERKDDFDEAARKAGILTYDEYMAQFETQDGEISVNSRKARSNMICQDMLDILGHPSSLEENLSRSNFDDITDAKNRILSKRAIDERKNRSPYNVFDQIKYQEDAMSGAELKGRSVMMDTFCSVCNTVRPKLENPIYVVYDNSTVSNLEEVQKRFDTALDDKGSRTTRLNKKNNTLAIRHNTYGYSNFDGKGDRNVAGKIITSYSSQTTAHILDAIKEGAVPGVNTFTFEAYKTIVQVGSDYDTAIAFITQPGISYINEAYERHNSVFAKSYGNPVKDAVRRIATELGVKFNYNTDIGTLLSQLHIAYGERFNEIFRQEGDAEIHMSLNPQACKNIPLIVSKMKRRTKGLPVMENSSDNRTDELLFDLGMVLAFNYINSTAKQISSIVSCCNPDKFGAKQTVFATDKVFEDIRRQLFTRKSHKEKNGVLTVNGKHILRAIYPGIEEGTLENPLLGINEHRVQESAYPTLMAYIKYSSGSSILIHRNLYETQNPRFVELVKGISSVLDGKPITEELYNNFQKYLLANMYNNVDFIAYPLSVSYERRKNTGARRGKLTVTPVVDESSKELAMQKERERIYGFRRPPMIANVVDYTTENGTNMYKYEEVTVFDANDPTDVEIANFAKLSPAQKVQFIKEHFEDLGIFQYLEPSLFNASNRGWRKGMQTIEFTEETIDKNVCFRLMKEAFYNTNPLVQLTAMDLIKYAVSVESLIMSAKGISKILPNTPLLGEMTTDANSGVVDGTNFVSQLRSMMGDILSGSLSITEDSMNQIYENYIRGHRDINGVRTIYMNKKNNVELAPMRHQGGIIELKPKDINVAEVTKGIEDETQKAVAIKKARDEAAAVWGNVMTTYGLRIEFENDDAANEYIWSNYIKVQDKGVQTLYRVKVSPNHDRIFLYPLNNLEHGECTTWSANEDNNVHDDPSYYEALIKAFFDAKAEDIDKFAETANIPRASYNKSRNIPQNMRSVSFDLESKAKQAEQLSRNGTSSATYGFFNAYEAIKDFFDPGKQLQESLLDRKLYIRSSILKNYITSFGTANGSVQRITYENGTKTVTIERIDLSNILRKALAQENGVYKYTASQLDNFLRAEALHITDELVDIIVHARQQKMRPDSVNDIFLVREGDYVSSSEEAAYESAYSEAAVAPIDYMSVAVKHGDEDAVTRVAKIKKLGYDGTSQSIERNEREINRELSAYVNTKRIELETNFNNFILDPENPGAYLSMIDPKVQGILQGTTQVEGVNREELLKKYMKLLNEIDGFLNNFEPFMSIPLDASDGSTKFYVDKMREDISRVQKLPFKEAMSRLQRGYISSLSTNPLIKTELIEIMDGYYRTVGDMWKFFDVQEASNPLVQTMLKDVMTDLEAKNKATKRRIQDYRKEVERIKKEAAAHGQTIDMSKIIDEHGVFVGDFKAAFIERYEDLRDAARAAASTFGMNSVEHLKAKLEFDEFKAKHLNQEAKPEYYIRKVHNEKVMLENAPELFSLYKRLLQQQAELISYQNEDSLSEEDRKILEQTDAVLASMRNLDWYRASDGTDKPRPTDPSDPDYAIYGRDKIVLLNGYMKAMKDLNEEYFEYDSRFGFEEQLNKNLEIVRTAENRDAFGIPQTPYAILATNSQYQEAKLWLKDNAKFVVLPDDSPTPGEDTPSVYQLLTKAFAVLQQSRNAKHPAINKILKDKGAYDAHGIPDGRMLTDEERARLKTAVKSRYDLTDMPDGTDRILISNAPHDDTLYKKSFYDGMKLNGESDSDYYALVTRINLELSKYLDPVDGIVHFERVPDNADGIAYLNNLGALYAELRNTKKYRESTNGAEVAAFREENVETVYAMDRYNEQYESGRGKSDAWKIAWASVNLDYDKDGQPIKVDDKYVPNSYLYGVLKPKAEKMEQFIDRERTEAFKVMNRFYKKEPTPYWWMAVREAQARAESDPSFDYAAWWASNYVYNPYTRKYELLDCWTDSRLNDDAVIAYQEEHRAETGLLENLKARWQPRSNNKVKKLRDGMITLDNGQQIHSTVQDKRNPDYNEDGGPMANYVKGSEGGIYDNPDTMNEYEKELSNYLKGVLGDSAITDDGRRFFANGYAPRRMKKQEAKGKVIARETAKMFGMYVTKKIGTDKFFNEIGYDKDYTPRTPMTQLLKDKGMGSEEFTEPEPKRTEYPNTLEGNNQFRDAYNAWAARKDAVRKKNREVNDMLLDKDWISVIEEYLARAGRFNAVQDNTQKLYLLLNMLEHQKTYSMTHDIYGKFDIDSRRGNAENPIYTETEDRNLIEWYKNFLRRLIFDQWKEDAGKFVTLTTGLQGFTSANYMMLNYRGGIANVTVGEAGIFAEAAAREFIRYQDWAFGTGEWIKASIGTLARAYSDKAITKADAVAKYFDVVEYDEITGVAREVSMEELSKRVRDWMFHPQTIGEHFMQNSVLYGMLHSHRIMQIDDDSRGIFKAIMNEDEYIRYRELKELKTLLTDEQVQRLEEFKRRIKADVNETAQYAWLRKDFITDFIYLELDDGKNNAAKNFLKARNEKRKEYINEFRATENIWDQCELGEDGYMKFKDGSTLAALHEQLMPNGKVTQAEQLMADMTERVRKVNNKIHGVYNKLGRGWIEHKWYGGLLMQYHKHLPMGLLKRFRRRGYYNEFRGANEKGFFWSLFYDFFALNARKVAKDYGWTEHNVNAIESLQFLLRHSFDYIMQLKATWNILPDYERANIARNLGDLVGVLSGVMTVIGLLAMGGGDDDDGILYNLALYEADRLASETFLYNPIGLYTEGKTLMSTPVAAQSILTDAFNAIKNIGNWMFGSEESNMYYRTGQYAGRNKLSVYLERRIPIWNGIRGIRDIPHNNHYYKRGKTAVSIIPTKEIAEWLRGEM